MAAIEADKLGQLRTGAASAVATKYMARQESSRLGIFGTGLQARSQLQAICAVRPIKTVLAYSRDPEKRETFCKEMTELRRNWRLSGLNAGRSCQGNGYCGDGNHFKRAGF